MINAHPGLPDFDYIRPRSLAEASAFLAEHAGQARPFMGGTDLFVRMRDGAWNFQYLVDVKALGGASDVAFDPQAGLTLGAAVSMNRTAAHPAVREHYPLLAQAIHRVAAFPLRSRATVVGNVCNGSPAGDTIGACIVFQGRLVVHGVGGWREEPLTAFFKGPGKTTLQPGDVVTALKLPVPPAGSLGKYIKLGRNTLSDLAIVGVTALGFPAADAASGYRFRLVLASVAPVPLVPEQAEAILSVRPIDDSTIAAAAEAAMAACTPISDTRGSAQYRKLMVRNLTRQALAEIWQQLRGAGH